MNKQTQKKLLKIVKRNYEEIADDFNETRKKYLWPELIKLAKPVKDGDKILDVGCGNGRLIEAFKSKNIYYLGIDSNKKLIDYAKPKYVNNRFIIGDILELDKILENNFNYVFCIAVFHHIPGRDLRIMALKQLKDKISGDGKIIIAVWNLWSQARFRKLILKFALVKLLGRNSLDFGDILFDWKDSAGQRVDQRYYHAFRKKGLKAIIKKAGLKIEKIYKDKFNYYMILKKHNAHKYI